MDTDRLRRLLSELLGKLWDFVNPSQMGMSPDEAVPTLQYINRLEHLRTPNPLEGEVTHARSCFLLRYYSGEREIFWADTGARELVPLSFFASYRGQPEHYNIEVGTSKG